MGELLVSLDRLEAIREAARCPVAALSYFAHQSSRLALRCQIFQPGDWSARLDLGLLSRLETTLHQIINFLSQFLVSNEPQNESIELHICFLCGLRETLRAFENYNLEIMKLSEECGLALPPPSSPFERYVEDSTDIGADLEDLTQIITQRDQESSIRQLKAESLSLLRHATEDFLLLVILITFSPLLMEHRARNGERQIIGLKNFTIERIDSVTPSSKALLQSLIKPLSKKFVN
jgi:hypothetical protein